MSNEVEESIRISKEILDEALEEPTDQSLPEVDFYGSESIFNTVPSDPQYPYDAKLAEAIDQLLRSSTPESKKRLKLLLDEG